MSESSLQIQICNMLKIIGVEHFKCTNEQKGFVRNKMAYWAKLKAEGYVAGVADLILLYPNGKVVFFEIKRPAEYAVSKKTGKQIILKSAGIQSAAQKDWQKMVENMGFHYHLIDNLQEARKIAEGHKSTITKTSIRMYKQEAENGK